MQRITMMYDYDGIDIFIFLFHQGLSDRTYTPGCILHFYVLSAFKYKSYSMEICLAPPGQPSNTKQDKCDPDIQCGITMA